MKVVTDHVLQTA